MNAGGDEPWRRAQLSALGDEIRSKRLALGLSQETVAGRAGMSTRTYRSFEMAESTSGGELDPRLSSLLRVLETLGVDDAITCTIRLLGGRDRNRS